MVPSLVAGLLLFWPAVLLVFLIGFVCIVFAVVFLGSTMVLAGIFGYGVYCILRDLGMIHWLLEKIGTISSRVSDHVKQNLHESFEIQDMRNEASKGPSLYVCHPHGLYGMTWFLHFAASLTKWPGERPVLAVHSVFFHIPILRELFQLHRCIEAKEESICKALEEGHSVALLVGGIEELLVSGSSSVQLILDKRKGFARIAKRMKVPIIPVVSPSENDLFPATQVAIWKWIQTFLAKTLHIAIPLPSWQSLQSWLTLTYKPFSTPLVTYLLDPVVPDEKSFEDIKSEYKERLLDFATKMKISIQVVG